MLFVVDWLKTCSNPSSGVWLTASYCGSDDSEIE